jgi:hypothetical protein
MPTPRTTAAATTAATTAAATTAAETTLAIEATGLRKRFRDMVVTVRKLSTSYGSSGSRLLTHAELSMLLWSLLLLAIFVPLALRRFNRTLAS